MKPIDLDLENPKIRALWETVLEARREVASWPAWKRGEYEDSPHSAGGPAPAGLEPAEPPPAATAPKQEPER